MKAAIFSTAIQFSAYPPNMKTCTVWRVSDWEESNTHSEGWKERTGVILFEDRFYVVKQLLMPGCTRPFIWEKRSILPQHIGQEKPRKINFSKGRKSNA